jgi:hypothetical protein
MNEPLALPRYIALVAKDALSSDLIKAWYQIVRTSAPTGTTMVIPSTDNDGMPRTVSLVHRHEGELHRYMIPLTRDLTEDEAAVIVEAFSEVDPDSEFDIECTLAYAVEPTEAPTISVDQDRYLELCTAWAKRQHDQWFRERAEQGWRYGTMISMTQKTNPLMVPWEQLPPKYRIPNMEEPQGLLDLLNDQGYAVITKTELESMMALMRGRDQSAR